MNLARSKPLIALLLTAATAFLASAAEKPNIVFIMAEDLGYGDLGCYGQTKMAYRQDCSQTSTGIHFSLGQPGKNTGLIGKRLPDLPETVPHASGSERHE